VKGLAENLSVLSADEIESAKILLNAGQAHLFENWPAPGQKDDQKKKLLAQAKLLNAQYPGGLTGYVNNAKKLLIDSKNGANPYDGYTPSVPSGERLTVGNAEFHESERLGIEAAYRTGFVLVAGGLGERLGYEGIKISLPNELVTDKPFIQLYVEYILAIQARGRVALKDDSLIVPLAIMTSGDTHAATVKLLADNADFGMAPGQLTIVKQEKVPSLLDNDARFAVEDNDPFEISTKPHGHGDVHTLLHQYGVVGKWVEAGVQWIVFFQDTNGVVFRAIPALLGVSVKNDFEVNSLTVPRKPGEAVGGICRLTKKDGTAVTINVEYNQLDPLLRETISKDGDVPDASGFSPFPGNLNVLVFKARPYRDTLQATGGSIPEFVNPKYKDAAKTTFKKPTRLECMMQDYPKLLGSAAKVGFTQIERWLSFSAVKNSLEEAAAKYKATGFPESAASGEADIYFVNRKLLQLGDKVKIDASDEKQVFAGIPVEAGAKIVLGPSFGVTQAEIAEKLKGADIHISGRSTLVLDGDNISIKSLKLDGTLVVKASAGSKVEIDGLVVKNGGWQFKEINVNDKSVDQKYRIRGYVLEKKGGTVIASDGASGHANF
jgi:UDP-sugar pyrophosphorylase